jgi:hypothetical protein
LFRVHEKPSFNNETWWTVSFQSDEKQSSQGATDLLQRCKATYNWSLEKKSLSPVVDIEEGLCEDCDATILLASNPVDQMWQEHILDL